MAPGSLSPEHMKKGSLGRARNCRASSRSGLGIRELILLPNLESRDYCWAAVSICMHDEPVFQDVGTIPAPEKYRIFRPVTRRTGPAYTHQGNLYDIP